MMAEHYGVDVLPAQSRKPRDMAKVEAGVRFTHLPTEAAITRLVGAILLEQNDEWAVQRSSYITLEGIAPIDESPLVSLPTLAA